jgi:hypothetical protein
MDIEVVVEGVPDGHVTTEITRALRRVCSTVYRTGRWSVLVAPSETRGEWDLGVRGPFGNHFVSFVTEADQLPALVAEHLRACF